MATGTDEHSAAPTPVERYRLVMADWLDAVQAPGGRAQPLIVPEARVPEILDALTHASTKRAASAPSQSKSPTEARRPPSKRRKANAHCSAVSVEVAAKIRDTVRAAKDEYNSVCIADFDANAAKGAGVVSLDNFSMRVDGKLGEGQYGLVLRLAYRKPDDACLYYTALKAETVEAEDAVRQSIVDEESTMVSYMFREQTALQRALDYRNLMGVLKRDGRLPEEPDAIKNWIVPVLYDWWMCPRDNGEIVVYTLMENVLGITLESIIQQMHLQRAGRDDWIELMKSLHTTCASLDAMGIFHGDLHSGNVIYDTSGKRYTVIDFGFAEVRRVEAGENFRMLLFLLMAWRVLPRDFGQRTLDAFDQRFFEHRVRVKFKQQRPGGRGYRLTYELQTEDDADMLLDMFRSDGGGYMEMPPEKPDVSIFDTYETTVAWLEEAV